MSDSSDSLKVIFLLERDERGYPPVERELLWCNPGPAGTYEIANIPYFVRGIALWDLVRVEHDPLGPRFAGRVMTRNHSTIRLAGPDLDIAERELRALGCDAEWSGRWNILAVDVPHEVAVRARGYIEAGAATHRWDYEEGSVAPAWVRAAAPPEHR
jgi:hypothetical protein